MQLIAPDVLAEAHGLTGAMSGTICVLGFALWLFGWRWHRFWIVAGITLTAGLIGLSASHTNGTQVMAVGILVAVAAGLMALELAKVLAFVAGGCGAWLAVQWVLPQAHELWAVFLCGGLFGLLLYRLWTMLLTSLIGALLALHAGLILAEPFFSFNSAAWVAQNVAALNGVVVGFVVLGILVQAASAPEEADEEEEKNEKKDHKEKKKEKHKKDEPHSHGEHAEPEPAHDHAPVHAPAHAPAPAKRAPWWKKVIPSRKAA